MGTMMSMKAVGPETMNLQDFPMMKTMTTSMTMIIMREVDLEMMIMKTRIQKILKYLGKLGLHQQLRNLQLKNLRLQHQNSLPESQLHQVQLDTSIQTQRFWYFNDVG